MRKQSKKAALRKETLRKLSTGELSMVAGATVQAGLPTTDATCPFHSCMISCPVNTGGHAQQL
jgi:hypothetical protein